MTTTTHTRHVLLAIRNGQPTIERIYGRVDAAGSWGEAIDAHSALEAVRLASGVSPRELHYAVRDSDHELVIEAARLEAAKLGSRQAAILRTFAQATEGWNWVKPGSRKSAAERARWDRAAAATGLARSWDYTGVARTLADRGLLRITDGMAYAPKSYRVTLRGRLVADQLGS